MSRLIGKEFDDFLDRLQGISADADPFERREHLISISNLSKRKLFNSIATRLESNPGLSVIESQSEDPRRDPFSAWVGLLELKKNVLVLLKFLMNLPENGVGYLWYLKPEMAYLGRNIPIEFSPFEPASKDDISVDAHLVIPGDEEPIKLPGFSYGMATVLHMMKGVEPWRIKKCSGCERFFVQASMRERLFHDRSCANRYKSRLNWAARKSESGGQ